MIVHIYVNCRSIHAAVSTVICPCHLLLFICYNSQNFCIHDNHHAQRDIERCHGGVDLVPVIEEKNNDIVFSQLYSTRIGGGVTKGESKESNIAWECYLLGMWLCKYLISSIRLI
jgi:hypothetical protein